MNDKHLLIEKAKALEPKLNITPMAPVATVSFERQDGRIAVTPAEEYSTCALKSGDTVTVDFGNHFVGRLSFELDFQGSHPDAPAWLQIQFAERPSELFEDPAEYHGWISKGWIQTEQFHVDVLPAKISLPRRYAFRYVKFTVLDVSNKYSVTVKNCCCQETTCVEDSDLPEFQSEDELLRSIDKVACRTLRNCMQTVFEDGPKRDRRLWMGDLRLQALANYQTYQKNDLVKRCLYLFAGTADPEGRVAACLFTEPEIEGDDTFMFDYSLFFIATLRDYWKATGDMETVKDLWPTAVRQAELAQKQFNGDLVRDSDVLGWCFVDWNLALNKQASAQAIYIYCMNALAEMAQVMGSEEKANEIREDIQRKKKAAAEHLWDKEKQVFVSGADRQVSWASQVWMILAGAAEDGKALLDRISQMEGAVTMVTPYLTHHYVEALLQVGEREKAIQVIRDYWGGMVKQGADTFWELYDPADPNASPYGGTIVNSFCHAWSCTPTYILRKLGDISCGVAQ